ncbi:PLP-dependent aminotransferase family protein (plasmid) [Pseudorhodobacter turbinis]|uniref:PLP-dependent aminotransferase family protein n=1 Tax=Pseudorhodobacter turbinis TaxID=2500533 RepID=A0A4P8EJ00_9RHOB|nr:PLP-dependent aminotransferase family protein [Pseudorhodobacter turbinis]QCO57150.1 PLP-dependent aminotransferase family protein [Pseudorhodobacter turbinis]
MTNTTWLPDLTQFPGPKYLALVRALRDAIRAGTLPPDSQLPTVRELAWQLQITPGTVSRAYQLATQEGLLAATVGRGTFVASATPRFGPTQSFYVERDPAHLAGRIDMRAPKIPDVGQAAAFNAAFAGGAPDMTRDWLDYPSYYTEEILREALVHWLEGRVLGDVTADDIALSYGGQNAVNLIFQCCLRGDRPMVLIEDLAYAGFRHAARLSRADVQSLEGDAEGLRPDVLEAACRRHSPQILCLTTEAQNPTTVRMTESRRREIADIARAYEMQILEDDCYSIAKSDIPSLRALAPERTWHVGSFSKSVSAALRLGYIVCPSGMGRAGRLTAQHSFIGLARPISDLCLSLLTSGVAADLRAKVQDGFSDRLEAVVNVLGGYDLAWQPGLPFVWLRLPSGWRASTFARMAEAEGVLLRSADEFALVHGRAPNAVRMAIPGNHSCLQIELACRRLARLLDSPPAELSV